MNHEIDTMSGKEGYVREKLYRFRLEDKYKSYLPKKALDEIAQEVLDLLSTKGLKIWQIKEVFHYANERITWMDFR